MVGTEISLALARNNLMKSIGIVSCFFLQSLEKTSLSLLKNLSKLVYIHKNTSA